MAYRIDDDENRIQDIKDQIDSLEVQTFSPEVVARNESTRNTGIETGDGAATNPYPEWYPVRDFGDVGLVTQEIVLNRVDSQIAKMRIIGDVDFAFSEPPPTNKGMWFILDVTIDSTGGYTINLPGNVLPSGTVIDNTANSRTVLRFTTTDGGVTFFAENISVAGGAVGDNLGDHIATQSLLMNDNTIFLDSLLGQSIFALALANNYVVPVGGAHDFFVNDTVIPKFGITEFQIESNLDLDMNTNNIFNMGGETINALTEDVSPAGAADFVMTFDASDMTLKKVLLNNLPGGGGGASPLTTKGDLFGFDTADARIPVGADTQVLTANSAVALGVEWAAATVLLSNVTIDDDKSWNDKNITDLLSVGSSAAIVPGSGFIRMGTAEEIRMKNPGGDDDIIITSGLDALSNDAIIFGTEGTTVFTMSLLNTDFKDTNLIGTGDILPRGQVHTVGDSVDFYAEMHSDIFITESSSVNPSLFGLAKIGNTLFINYDDTNVDAGFAIFEQGIRHFLFHNPSASVHELFIGPDPFNAGEEYAIQLGENSTSSGRISFIEGVDTDVIIDRAGGGIDQGVQVRVDGLSAQRWLSGETKFFKSLNINSQDITNVGNVLADTSETATIGEINGGFDYILRDRISWELDPDTFIEMSSSGLSLVSDDAITMSSVDQMNISITASTGLNILVASAVRATIQDNGLVLATGTSLFVQSNFANFAEIATPVNPPVNEGRMFAADEGGTATPFWIDQNGTVTSMISGGSTGANTTLSNLVTTSINQSLIPNSTNTLDLGASGLQWANLWVSTLQNATTVAIASPIFSINSSQIILGDSDTDDIQFFGQVATGITFEETSTPADTPPNTGRLFVIDEGGVSNPFWIDELGTISSMIASGGGATSLSDLTDVQVTGALTDDVFIFDGSLWVDTPQRGLDSDSWKQTNQTGTNIWYGLEINTPFNIDVFDKIVEEEQAWYAPLIITKPATITGFGVYVVVGVSGDSYTVALYTNRTDGIFAPLNLIVSGSSGTDADFNEMPIGSTDLSPGLYWIAVKPSNKAVPGLGSLRVIPYSSMRPILGYEADDDGDSLIGSGLGYLQLNAGTGTNWSSTVSFGDLNILNSGGGGAEASDNFPQIFTRYTKY